MRLLLKLTIKMYGVGMWAGIVWQRVCPVCGNGSKTAFYNLRKDPVPEN